MRALNEQWIVKIDGVRHMVKAVKQRPEISHIAEKVHPCHKCLFQMDDYDCAYPSGDWKCDMEKGLVIHDLGLVNEDGLLGCPFCRESPKIGNFGDGFSDITFYVKHDQSECVICGLMRTKSFKTKQQSIDAWNWRAM